MSQSASKQQEDTVQITEGLLKEVKFLRFSELKREVFEGILQFWTVAEDTAILGRAITCGGIHS